MASSTIVTPIGVAIYPHLNLPNTKFNQEGIFDLGLQLPDVEYQKLVKEIETAIQQDVGALAAQHRFDVKTVRRAALPWKLSKDGKSWIFSIKNNRMCGSGNKRFEFKPKLFDANAQPWPIEEKIGYGSRVRVSFSPFVWFVKSELGISLRLKAVQVIESKDGQSAESYGFSAVAAPSTGPLTDAEFASGTAPSDETREMDTAEFIAEFKKIVVPN